ncbi:MAG: glycosyltransferase family 4 protein [Candidatus Magasanikbacteria bacterium]|nr:glycosyltransferase family 4 protein [Candidatus Magasanikbacteria bacterium]
MKIGIDARMYGPKQAGLGRYVQQLITGLFEIDSENEFVFFVRDVRDPLLTSPRSAELRAEAYKGEGKVRVVVANIPWYGLAEQIKFKKIIQKEKVDLMHFPHWNVPLFYNDPFVVTIHDLIMYHYPRPEATTLGPIKFWLKDRAHRIVLRHAVSRAKKLIVTSEFTKQDVLKTLGVPAEKMAVVYQAPFERNKKQETNKLQIKNYKLKITKPYVLYVGNAYPHKNLGRLLKAWGIFQNKCSSNYQLVLVGKRSLFYDRLFTSSHHHIITSSHEQFNNPPAGEAGLTIKQSGDIIFTDFVTDAELAVLYQNARLYVFPSLYEGFGLPPLEAQRYGAPVISSSASCLPEVLGESALYFDPENVEQMADAIQRGLTDEDVRFQLKRNATENLKRFSGERMAREIKKIYEKCW